MPTEKQLMWVRKLGGGRKTATKPATVEMRAGSERVMDESDRADHAEIMDDGR